MSELNSSQLLIFFLEIIQNSIKICKLKISLLNLNQIVYQNFFFLETLLLTFFLIININTIFYCLISVLQLALMKHAMPQIITKLKGWIYVYTFLQQKALIQTILL